MSPGPPPRLAEWVLRHLLRTPDGEHILGDLAEEYAEARQGGAGRFAAALWYWKQVAASISPMLRRAVGAEGRVGRTYDPRRSARPIRAAAFAPADRLQETRQILRGFRRRPVFPALVVVTLGLGIGITTTTFAVAWGVLLRPFPLPDGERLVSLRHMTLARPDGIGALIGPATFRRYRDGSRLLEDAVAFHVERGYLTDDVPNLRIQAAQPTPGLGDLVGLPPVVGRWDRPEDQEAERWVAVLSHAFWVRQYGADPGVVGTVIHVDEEPVEVIGVAPPEAEVLADDIQMWVPIRRPLEELGFGGWSWRGIARLREGATLEDLRSELDGLFATLGEAMPELESAWRYWYEDFQVRPAPRYLLDERVGTSKAWIWLLLGASGVVLLVGLANVATLALERSVDRSTDVAVRSALGGGRGGLARRFALEATILAAGSVLVGLGLAYLVLRVLPVLADGIIPRIDSVGLAAPVAGATLVLAALCAVVLVVIPSLRVPRDVASTLRGASQGGGRVMRRFQGGLLVVQIGLAALLVVFGGLMARSFWTLRTLDLGFSTDGLYTFRLEFPLRDDNEPDKLDFFRRLQERILAIPGVTSVSASECVPLRCDRAQGIVTQIDDRWLTEEDVEPLMKSGMVMPGFFTTLGVPILQGRDLEWDDAWTPAAEERGYGISEDEGWVMYTILNERAAETLFPGVDPVGHHFRVSANGARVVVAGVVANVINEGLSLGAARTGLVRYMPDPRFDGMEWLVRADLSLEALLPSLRLAVRELAPTVPVEGATDYRRLVAEATRDRTLILLLALIGAGLSVVLGLVGVYGALAHDVRRRRRELGIRTALGAAADTLRAAVFQRAGVLLAVGLSVGLGLAAWSRRLLESVIYGVSPLDPSTYVGAALLMALLGLAAAWVPAARASRVNPIETLRTE